MRKLLIAFLLIGFVGDCEPGPSLTQPVNIGKDVEGVIGNDDSGIKLVKKMLKKYNTSPSGYGVYNT